MVAVVAGVLVGAALLASGVLKLAAGPAWRADGRRLGAPAAVLPVVPWAEVVLGALLVTGVGSPWTGWAAAGLLVAFTGLLVANLVQGRRPVCACFGALSRRPLSWWSVARNGLLLALAVVAAVG